LKDAFRRSVLGAIIVCSFCLSRIEAAPATQPLTSAQATSAALATKIPEFVARSGKLSDALARAAKMAQVQLDVRWDDLAEAGITKDSPIDLSIKNVTVGRTLAYVLRAAKKNVDAENAPQLEVLDNGSLLITSKRNLFKRSSSERRYDIDDLLVNVNAGPAKTELVTAISRLIQETVKPESWSATQGSIRADQNALVIVQTDQGHRDVMAAIAQLREVRSKPAVEDASETAESDPPQPATPREAVAQSRVMTAAMLTAAGVLIVSLAIWSVSIARRRRQSAQSR
jgi:hypothetical protein